MKASQRNFILFSIVYSILTVGFFIFAQNLDHTKYFGLISQKPIPSPEVIYTNTLIHQENQLKLTLAFTLTSVLYLILSMVVYSIFTKSFLGPESISRITFNYYLLVFGLNLLFIWPLIAMIFGYFFDERYIPIIWGALALNALFYYLRWHKENMQKEEVFK